MSWLALSPEILPVVVFLISFGREPRKFRTGVYLFLAVGWLAVLALVWALSVAHRLDVGWYFLYAVVAVAGLTVIALAVFSIIAGITLIRREGYNPRRLLSIILGVLLLASLAAVVVPTLQANGVVIFWLMLIAGPAGYLGIGFASFVLYGLFYPRWMARFGQQPSVVVVLGSGLIDGAVPPLLADRLRAGKAVWERATAAGQQAVLITSGGKGPDEPRAEAVAMREFLLAEGVPDEALLVEDRSRNTQQNLAYSSEVMQANGLGGRVAVVTSDFHALRAAFLMRKAGIPGYTVGARTARYFWPTAVIREYAAVLRDHFWLNAVVVALTSVPLVIVLTNGLGVWR